VSRPRKPTALKLVSGTARADRANGNEPEPDVLREVEPPAHLGERSVAVWRELSPVLCKNQVLTEMDLVSLEVLCDAVADYRLARTQRGDQLVTHSSKGSQMLDQLLIAQQACAKLASTYMGRFGMDPVSRSRVFINPQADLFSDAAGTNRFFGGSK